MRDRLHAGDQFSFSLIYLFPGVGPFFAGWGSILVFPDILDIDTDYENERLGINSRFP